MSADERKRKIEALGASGVRRNPDGSVELVPGGAADSGGGLGASSRVAAAKALLQRAGMGSGKSHKKEKKHKKENKHKKEKKTSKKASKKRKRDRGSGSDSDTSDSDESASGGEVGKARRWKSGGKALKPSSKDDQAWSAPPGPDVKIEAISDDDYYLKNHEFAAWLKHTRKVYFTDLLAQDAREAFKGFITEWNARRLPAKLYEGISVAGRR